jgi:hypothetical protein
VSYATNKELRAMLGDAHDSMVEAAESLDRYGAMTSRLWAMVDQVAELLDRRAVSVDVLEDEPAGCFKHRPVSRAGRVACMDCGVLLEEVTS